MKSLLFVFSFLLVVAGQRAGAQSYAIDWFKIAGGGGTSTNGAYSISGTIGQADASGAMSGGSYSLTGGFWSLLAVVQTPGLPNLAITRISPNSVAVSWPNTVACTLQANQDVATANWTAYGGTVATNNGTNSVTITSPTGKLFFRLHQP